jgi:hypothetical protein
MVLPMGKPKFQDALTQCQTPDPAGSTTLYTQGKS